MAVKNTGKRKKKNRLTPEALMIAAAAVIVAVIAAVFIIKSASDSGDETSNLSAGTSTSAVSTSAHKTEHSTEEKTSGTTATTQRNTEAPTKTQTGSFYDNVNYRSPTAKPADIFKHGRNLMLLNNDWELPEDFKWELVAWTNGQRVDAANLNKQKVISEKYVDKAAYQPLKDMFKAAADAGVPLQLVSAYRGIAQQDRLFTESVNSYINQGYKKADAIKKANFSRTFTGTSEHNTGLGFDILEKGNFTLSSSFDKTAQFKWLSEHAAEFGFILRYDKDKVGVTEIMYEPWHFRYVGIENAKKINDLGFCLEEYIDYLEK